MRLNVDTSDSRRVVIGTIGRLVEIKRQDVLIRAFAKLAKRWATLPRPSHLPDGEGCGPAAPGWEAKTQPGAAVLQALTPDACRLTPSPPTPAQPTPDACRLTPSLLLVGAGPERENLEKLAKDLGVGDRVQFAGYQAEPERWLAQMDVFTLTSRSEGMPVSILEAWAAGVPVVASAVGGVPELVVDGETGLLFPSGDDAALAACFERLLSDQALAERLAAAGRERVEGEFSLARMAERYQELYREVYERELAVEERLDRR